MTIAERRSKMEQARKSKTENPVKPSKIINSTRERHVTTGTQGKMNVKSLNDGMLELIVVKAPATIK